MIPIKTDCMNVLSLTFLFFYFSFNSCNINNKKNLVKTPECDTVLNLDTSIFKRYVNHNVPYSFIKSDVRRTGLKSLENGYDSIAIRLWYQYAGPVTEIVEIRKHCEGWIAEFSTIKRHIDGKDTLADIVHNEITPAPKSGWQAFTQRLFDLNITTLPDWSEIPNYNPSNDGEGVDIEISTKQYYRIYSYLGPKTHTHLKEVVAIENIMDLIEAEFGIIRMRKI